MQIQIYPFLSFREKQGFSSACKWIMTGCQFFNDITYFMELIIRPSFENIGDQFYLKLIIKVFIILQNPTYPDFYNSAESDVSVS